MLYFKRLKCRSASIDSTKQFLLELKKRSIDYSLAVHDKISEVINEIVGNHSDEIQPKARYLKREGRTTIGDLATGLVGIGLGIGMRAQTAATLTLPNKTLEVIEQIIPYIGTVPIRISLLTGQIFIVVPEVIGALGIGSAIGSIPGTDIPVPGAEFIDATIDEVNSATETIMEFAVDYAGNLIGIGGTAIGSAVGISETVAFDTIGNAMDAVQDISTGKAPVDSVINECGTIWEATKEVTKTAVDVGGDTTQTTIDTGTDVSHIGYDTTSYTVSIALDAGKDVVQTTASIAADPIGSGMDLISPAVDGVYGIGGKVLEN